MTAILEALWAWFLKWGSGFIPNTGEKMGKILWVVGIVLLISFATNFFQKPSVDRATYNGPVTKLTEDPQVKYSSFGCTAGHVRAALQWKW